MEPSDNTSIIAPCGMNCSICMSYLRERKKCSGCRGSDLNKPVTCIQCKIKNCTTFQNGNALFCFECDSFPCDKLKHLDKRYRTKYHMSMIENLETIQKSGLTVFLENERIKWTCSKCGGTICVHKGYCYSCGEIGRNAGDDL